MKNSTNTIQTCRVCGAQVKTVDGRAVQHVSGVSHCHGSGLLTKETRMTRLAETRR